MQTAGLRMPSGQDLTAWQPIVWCMSTSVATRERADLLQQGADKASNFAVSVGLSLKHLPVGSPGRRLLTVLARLPDGIRRDDLTGVLGDDGIKAAADVNKVGIGQTP